MAGWVPVMATNAPHRAASSTIRYVGMADRWGAYVWVEQDGARSSLPYRGEARLAGFAWGRPGMAARELARALLEHATGNPALAERCCRELTHAIVARLPADGFELDRRTLLAWLVEADVSATAPTEASPRGDGGASRSRASWT